MSTVPPSPAWPTTRTSSRPFTFSAAATPVATAGALPNSEWIQGSCHDDSGNGVEKTSRQPVALAAISLPLGGPHRRVERVAGAERLAAALAGPVPGGERVGAVHPRLHRALLGVEQAVADHEGPAW